jgi:hypothetical protein
VNRKKSSRPQDWGYLMEQQLLGLPACMTVVRGREMALRLPKGKQSMGDWTWYIMGNFRRLMPRERMWLHAGISSMELC